MCAYPLIKNEETGQEQLPIEYGVDGQSDDQLVPNIEESKDMTSNESK